MKLSLPLSPKEGSNLQFNSFIDKKIAMSNVVLNKLKKTV